MNNEKNPITEPQSVVTVDIEPNLPTVMNNHEISTIPLLSIHSSVIQEKDDILCESADSDDFHKLEANV